MKTFLTFTATIVLSFTVVSAQQSDAALRRVIDQDAAGTEPLSAAEHLSRAEVYSSNRLFPQARVHWQKVFDVYPDDAGIPKALFGTARSFMWEREYQKAVEWFSKLTQNHLNTKDGREGLAFKGASLVRLGKNLEAAKVYEQYTVMFPDGEKIESSHLNIIDANREAGKYDEANKWVDITMRKFAGKPAEVNALHARLRMEIFRGNCNGAYKAANILLNGTAFTGSMASVDEVKYLKGFALESCKLKVEALLVYESIPSASYFGGLAANRFKSEPPASAGGAGVGQKNPLIHAGARAGSVPPAYAGGSDKRRSEYPVLYRTELLRESVKRTIDPRFVLAIMKQESSFKPGAKSPAGARGLLQLVYDTAIKYNKKAGYPNLQPDDLYKPAVSIAIGSQYVADLKDEFDGLYEAIAASYNAGEDNAGRWLKRTKPKDPGIFAAEIGFAETKNYVFKVMNNYRVYRDLYTEQLQRR